MASCIFSFCQKQPAILFLCFGWLNPLTWWSRFRKQHCTEKYYWFLTVQKGLLHSLCTTWSESTTCHHLIMCNVLEQGCTCCATELQSLWLSFWDLVFRRKSKEMFQNPHNRWTFQHEAGKDFMQALGHAKVPRFEGLYLPKFPPRCKGHNTR